MLVSENRMSRKELLLFSKHIIALSNEVLGICAGEPFTRCCDCPWRQLCRTVDDMLYHIDKAMETEVNL